MAGNANERGSFSVLMRLTSGTLSPLTVWLRGRQELTKITLCDFFCCGVFFLDSWHHEQSTVQSRVRRLIGRRRGGGLDRYVGMFQREAAPLQDNVDPITELLSQLSGWCSFILYTV